MNQTDLYNSIVRRIADLSEDSLLQLSHTISFLKWQEEQWREWGDEDLDFAAAQGASPDIAATQPRWVLDLINQFEQATVTATQTSQGMEVRVAPAHALDITWQSGSIHPSPAPRSCSISSWCRPPQSDCVSRQSRHPQRFADCRDAGQLRCLSFLCQRPPTMERRQNTTTWDDVSVDLPTLAGEYATIQLVTDGLGDSRWNWAVWGTPLLIGE